MVSWQVRPLETVTFVWSGNTQKDNGLTIKTTRVGDSDSIDSGDGVFIGG